MSADCYFNVEIENAFVCASPLGCLFQREMVATLRSLFAACRNESVFCLPACRTGARASCLLSSLSDDLYRLASCSLPAKADDDYKHGLP